MQAKIYELVHMRLKGTMVNLRFNVVRQLVQYVLTAQRKKLLYGWLAKALYGMIRVALLF